MLRNYNIDQKVLNRRSGGKFVPIELKEVIEGGIVPANVETVTQDILKGF